MRDADAGEEYARVERMLGDCRVEVQCFDGTRRKARICGAMQGRIFIRAGDIVLCSVRSAHGLSGSAGGTRSR